MEAKDNPNTRRVSTFSKKLHQKDGKDDCDLVWSVFMLDICEIWKNRKKTFSYYQLRQINTIKKILLGAVKNELFSPVHIPHSNFPHKLLRKFRVSKKLHQNGGNDDGNFSFGKPNNGIDLEV